MSKNQYKHEMVVVYNALTIDDILLFAEAVICKGSSYYEIAEGLFKRVMARDDTADIIQIVYVHAVPYNYCVQDNMITDDMILAMADVLDSPIQARLHPEMVMSEKTFNAYVQALINERRKSG